MWDWFYNWFIPICVTGFIGILAVAVVVSLVYILYEKATCYVDDLKYQKERGRNITYWWEHLEEDDLKEVQIQLNKALRALEKGKYTEVEEYIDNANEFLREWLD